MELERKAETLSPKKSAIYQAVLELFEEGADLGSLTVAEITRRAGIGKGTAYEYFSDKEEMIARALFYNVELFCQQIYEGLSREKNLYDKVNYILLEMERHVVKSNCILQMIHTVSDNSPLSRRLREMEKKNGPRRMSMFPIIRVIRQMLTDEIGGQTPLSEDQRTYLVMSVFSKILCYGMLLKNDRYEEEETRKNMRSMVCMGVCREVEDALEVKQGGMDAGQEEN